MTGRDPTGPGRRRVLRLTWLSLAALAVAAVDATPCPSGYTLNPRKDRCVKLIEGDGTSQDLGDLFELCIAEQAVPASYVAQPHHPPPLPRAPQVAAAQRPAAFAQIRVACPTSDPSGRH